MSWRIRSRSRSPPDGSRSAGPPPRCGNLGRWSRQPAEWTACGVDGLHGIVNLVVVQFQEWTEHAFLGPAAAYGRDGEGRDFAGRIEAPFERGRRRRDRDRDRGAGRVRGSDRHRPQLAGTRLGGARGLVRPGRHRDQGWDCRAGGRRPSSALLGPGGQAAATPIPCEVMYSGAEARSARARWRARPCWVGLRGCRQVPRPGRSMTPGRRRHRLGATTPPAPPHR